MTPAFAIVNGKLAARKSPNVFTPDRWRNVWWIETRYTRGHGWFAILWPWPRQGWFYDIKDGGLSQGPGYTLPVYCAMRAEAAMWASTLAERFELENPKRKTA